MQKKDADQLRGNRETDQCLCFRYTDSTMPLLPKYKISRLKLYSGIAKPGLCPTWLETLSEAQFSDIVAHIYTSITEQS